jgi:hypothetical protein
MIIHRYIERNHGNQSIPLIMVQTAYGGHRLNQDFHDFRITMIAERYIDRNQGNPSIPQIMVQTASGRT